MYGDDWKQGGKDHILIELIKSLILVQKRFAYCNEYGI